MNRRRCLRRAACAAAGFVILKNSASARGAVANERLNLAHVGVSGRGRLLLMDFARQANTVALCDVNQTRAAPIFQRFGEARNSSISARCWTNSASRSTPWWSPRRTTPTRWRQAAALRAGKHVYCEKPLTRTVHESRMLRELARQHQVATSMGNQGTGSGAFRRGLELIRAGRLGEIREVHMWSADSGGVPIRVHAEAEMINRFSFPRWELVRWEIPARGDLPPVTFHWHNGSRRPGMRDQLESLLGRGLDWGDKGERKWTDWAGCLIVGSEGTIYTTAHNSSFTLLPQDKFHNVQTARPEQVAPSSGHDADWLLACRGGPAPWANLDYAGPLTEFNMLGNVATQFDSQLEYDPLAGRIVNHEQANAQLSSEYRNGWSL